MRNGRRRVTVADRRAACPHAPFRRRGVAVKKFVLAIVAVLVAAGGAHAAAAPDSIRRSVQAEIDAVMAPDPDDPDDADYNPPAFTASAAMFRRVVVNDDGVADWRVDFEKAPNASYFCGTGGCRQQLWVSNAAGGFDLAMDTQVRMMKLRRAKTGTRLDVDFHGSICGGFGVDPCPRSYVWSGAISRFVARVGVGGETFLAGGPVRLFIPPEASLPAPVRAALAERTARCKALGRTYPYEEAFVTDIGDLNADGQSDWVVGGPYDTCAYAEDAPESVPMLPIIAFVSTPSGHVAAWRGEGVEWGLDLAGGGATFVTMQGAEECGLNGKDCDKTAWRWNGSTLVRATAPRP